MELSRRVELVQQQLDNITTDIDQPHGDCMAALESLQDKLASAIANLTATRDEQLRKRKEARIAKDAAIAARNAGAQ